MTFIFFHFFQFFDHHFMNFSSFLPKIFNSFTISKGKKCDYDFFLWNCKGIENFFHIFTFFIPISSKNMKFQKNYLKVSTTSRKKSYGNFKFFSFGNVKELFFLWNCKGIIFFPLWNCKGIEKKIFL